MTKEERSKYALDIIQNADEEKPIKASSLAIMWKTTARGVRDVVMSLRIAGEPICSNDNGYWYATEVKQMEETVRRIRAHALKELKAMSKMAKVLRENGYKL